MPGISMSLKVTSAALLLSCALPCCADAFGNDLGGSWAETPKGRFECRNDASTKFLQRITVAGTVIYQERGTNNPDGNGGPNLSNGILAYDPKINKGQTTIYLLNHASIVSSEERLP